MAVQIPETAPVMVLPDCNFFPGTPLPLRIFEPRYRAMLEFVLQGERMFCMGTIARESSLPRDEEAGIYRHGTLGLVRACVRNSDGTSNLLLEGLQRVAFEAWTREKPFRIAAITPVQTKVEDEARIEAASEKLHEFALRLCRVNLEISPQIQNHLQNALSPEALVDLVAFYLIEDVHTRHALLGMEVLLDRVTFVTERLRGKLNQFPDV
ncbi:MAG: Lon protease-like protein [Verrucomicrobiales bacterium]|jgi:Lon protease-like protein